MALTPAERQSRYRIKIYSQRTKLPFVPCACGCGTLIPSINKQGKTGKYAHGHNAKIRVIGKRFTKGQVAWNKGKPNPLASQIHRGKKLTAEQLAKRTATRLSRYGSYMSPEGKARQIANRPPTWRENMIRAIRKRDISGPKNPFYGKKHSPEIIEQIAAKHRGPLHPNWHGGTSTLPYGPEFTRRFRRLIRERDGNKCQRCGKTRKQHWRALEVHHIDHNKMNNNPTNLITVCGNCNVWLSLHREESPIAFPKRKMLLI